MSDFKRKAITDHCKHIWSETTKDEFGKRINSTKTPIAILLAPDNLHPTLGVIQSPSFEKDAAALSKRREADVLELYKQVKKVFTSGLGIDEARNVGSSVPFSCIELCTNIDQMVNACESWWRLGVKITGFTDVDEFSTNTIHCVTWDNEYSNLVQLDQ